MPLPRSSQVPIQLATHFVETKLGPKRGGGDATVATIKFFAKVDSSLLDRSWPKLATSPRKLRGRKSSLRGQMSLEEVSLFISTFHELQLFGHRLFEYLFVFPLGHKMRLCL